MTNKVDRGRLDISSTSAPLDATNTPVPKPNAEGGDSVGSGVAVELHAHVPPSGSSAETGGSRRQRLKGKTDMPPKDPNVELQARHSMIGDGLKRIFDEIVEEPIPPEFLELLDQIDRKREQ